jgi:hypothetical protein
VRVIDPGHTYELDNLREPGTSELRFFKDPGLHDGEHQAGPSIQEVLRACIDRVQYLDKEKHWHGNTAIIAHLRMALVLFESRNLERLVEKNEEVERIPTNYRGHFV